MNIMTAYRLGQFLEKRGQDRPRGDRFTSRRDVLAQFKRDKKKQGGELESTIDEMIEQGWIDARGSGIKGSGVREYCLTVTGEWFMSSFEKARPFMMALEPSIWDEFEMRTKSKPGGTEHELRKLIQEYNYEAAAEAASAGLF